VADAGVAVVVETDLNQLVSDDPILFDPSSTTISDESVATIDRVAAVAKRVGGITIVVEGHTDTDGRADSNQALSEGRARSVREALIVRGIAADTLTIVGFGGTEPILDADGVENKAASRRVEFVVSAT
jgi:OOP family OmpA-OmpF porin